MGRQQNRGLGSRDQGLYSVQAAGVGTIFVTNTETVVLYLI